MTLPLTLYEVAEEMFTDLTSSYFIWTTRYISINFLIFRIKSVVVLTLRWI